MGSTVTVPDLNAPLFDWWPQRLPPLTRWVVLSAFVALIAWLVFYLMDRHQHKCHKKNCADLKKRCAKIEARLGRHFPDSP